MLSNFLTTLTIICFLSIGNVSFGFSQPEIEGFSYEDRYIVESRIQYTIESKDSNGNDCTVTKVQHVVYRIDDDGQRWFYASGSVIISDCSDTDSINPPDDIDLPNDPDCPSVFQKNRHIANSTISEEYDNCFVDFVFENEANMQLVIDSEEKLLN